MNKIIARKIAPIAEWLFDQEWLTLKTKLNSIYEYHLRECESRPSILLQSLLISGEDHRFFTHGGFDIIAFCRVIWRGSILGKKEGASTIEMQIVRILTERYERTITRKVRETALATLLTQIVPKSEIPSIYIRIGYYGWQMNGLRAACNHLCLDPKLIKQADARGGP
jgi:membrane carboxypeptidase/penicillin-binding protein PbpC